jgi:hypothetical protein
MIMNDEIERLWKRVCVTIIRPQGLNSPPPQDKLQLGYMWTVSYLNPGLGGKIANHSNATLRFLIVLLGG